MIESLKAFLFGDSVFWTVWGFAGNLVFASRFVLQWYVSERLRRSVIPVAFWHLSIVGSAMMLIYAVHVWKAPLIVGFLFPTVIYVRNLALLKRHGSGESVPHVGAGRGTPGSGGAGSGGAESF